MTLPYRPNVMVCVFRKSDKKVLFCHRIKPKGITCWQFPQGGIEDGDSLEKTVFKEVYEEVGIKKELIKIIAIYPKKLKYDFPINLSEKRYHQDKFKGQEQSIFLIKFLGENKDIDLNIQTPAEFDQYKWVSIDDVLPKIIEFKKLTYKKILPYFKEIISK